MFTSPFPDVLVPEVPVHEFLFGDLGPDARDAVALVDGPTGATTTYSELLAQVDAVAGHLAARDVRPGDVVALFSPNCPGYAAAFHGILRAGATATTVNALYTVEEVETQLRDSGARMVLTADAVAEVASTAAAAVGLSDDQVLVLHGPGGRDTLDRLVADGAAPPAVTIEPASHVAVLPYSSGTTGHPKGVRLSHRNLVANVVQSTPAIGLHSSDTVIAVLPFFHIYGMTLLVNETFWVRAKVVTMPRFDLAEFLRLVQEHRATFVFIAPPIAVALAKHPMVDDYDLSSLEILFSGAAPLDGELAATVAKRLGCEVRQGYGMTEMSPVSHVIPRERADVPLDSVGLTIANMACRLVDPATGEEIELPAEGTSRPGELLCRGPNVMLGYLHDDEATRAMLEPDGFLHTGDVATVSSEGYVTVVDRVKELIKYKGYQVAPAELEALLLSHPDVADAAVVGVTDAEGEEVPKAFVVRQPGTDVTAEAVQEFVAAHVAPYKKVRAVEFIDAVPKDRLRQDPAQEPARPGDLTRERRPRTRHRLG